MVGDFSITRKRKGSFSNKVWFVEDRVGGCSYVGRAVVGATLLLKFSKRIWQNALRKYFLASRLALRAESLLPKHFESSFLNVFEGQ